MNPGRMDTALNRFPLKHLWDALALAQVVARGNFFYGGRTTFYHRMQCVDFYFNARGVRRLHAALFRSGVLWSELGMTLAIDLANGGDGEYVYKSDLFYPRDGLAYRRFDWRVPLEIDDEAFIQQRGDGPAFGELLYFHTRNPYFRVRSARLKEMKIVVLTRSILDALESRYVKFATSAHLTDVILDDESSFDWDQGLTRAIEFCNSWGDVMRWHPAIMHVRFEDLKADEVGCHREILKFWGFDVPEDCIAEGFRRASKLEMNKRMTPEERGNNVRAAFRGDRKRRLFSETRKRHIIDRLQRELIHNMGYEYGPNTAYGAAYD